MIEIVDFISQPWPWYVAGPSISLVMSLLLYFGNKFGLSSNFTTVCAIAGAGKYSDFFRFNWRDHVWNLVFVSGAILGGFIAHYFLSHDQAVNISNETIAELKQLGIENPGSAFVPVEIFNWNSLLTGRGLIMIVIGGFLVGFGTRYAGGCTSGHAISGLSNLQLPSLIAVIGFFIGGLVVTYLILPLIL